MDAYSNDVQLYSVDDAVRPQAVYGIEPVFFVIPGNPPRAAFLLHVTVAELIPKPSGVSDHQNK